MNILFIGAFGTDYLKQQLGSNLQSLYNSSEFLIKGFKKIKDINFKTITSPDITSYPIGPLYVKSYDDKKEDIKIVSSLNISFVKQLWIIITMVANAKKIIRKNEGITTVIIPYMVFRHVFASRLLKILFNKRVKICTIIPDIFFPKKNNLHNTFIYCVNKWTEKMARKSDCFVLYTEAMADFLKIKSKPYIIMEGVIDPEILDHGKINFTNYTHKKIITYSGSLNIKYGIIRLLDAVRLIEDSTIELHLLGQGDAEDIIYEYIGKDNRIKFLGMLSKEKTYIEQINSTMLINPRNQNDGEFTKYSFPSKNIEYLLTGKPTILTKLPGMPEDYYPYFIDAKDGSPEALAEAINKVLEMSEEERIIFGKNARCFILDNKNCYLQSKRIYELIKSIDIVDQ
jgi:glycosyltransferase involved in cell wall biosynthesis